MISLDLYSNNNTQIIVFKCHWPGNWNSIDPYHPANTLFSQLHLLLSKMSVFTVINLCATSNTYYTPSSKIVLFTYLLVCLMSIYFMGVWGAVPPRRKNIENLNTSTGTFTVSICVHHPMRFQLSRLRLALPIYTGKYTVFFSVIPYIIRVIMSPVKG